MTNILAHPCICQHCASQGPTCCSTSTENLEFCFPLSQEEIAVISSRAGGEEFFVQVSNSSGFISQLARLLPDYNVGQVFAATGTHWRLSVTQTGKCVFLGDAGCRLDRTIRPKYCRLFPLWVYQGQLTWFSMPECMAYKEYPKLEDLLAAMQTNGQEVRTLFTAMCAGLDLELCR
ncbi:MAG: zinc/iron-chelating domain-containing protein [Desulfomicrobium sp.]|nr:zinc/iron-chelating domain-containing protein [Desulfomicrobium sp.]NLV97108.1 zinc/iron-chelating domain-containing protein [Desulfovibrionales bacterium]